MKTTLSVLMGIGVQEIIVLLLLVLPLALFLWAIIDLIKRNFSNSTNKIIWALVIIFVPFIGSILYLAVGRRN
jgi:hypothetical protein